MKILETSHPDFLWNVIKILNTQLEEAVLKFDEEGLRVSSLSPDNMTFIELKILPNRFDYYYITTPVDIPVALVDVMTVLKKLKKNDKLILEYQPENKEIIFTLRGELLRRKKIKVAEIVSDNFTAPKVIFKSRTRLLLKALKEILDDFKTNDYFTICATDSTLSFLAESVNVAEETPLNEHSDTILEHFAEEVQKATYQVDHFHGFVREALKISEVAVIEFTSGMPMRLEIEIPHGELVLWAAPVMTD